MPVLSDVGNDLAQLGIYQPKLKNRWRITFVGVGTGTDDGQFMTVQAINVDRPKMSFEKIQLDRYNSRVWIAGKYTFDPMNLVFEDDTGGLVSQGLQNQLQKQQSIIAVNADPELPASAAGELYKFSIRLDMLDGNETIFESWSIDGCWIESIDYTELDYAASEVVKINLSVSYDLARQILTGTTYKAHPASGAIGG